jgi:tyrosine-protein kinase Etk/Wzc
MSQHQQIERMTVGSLLVLLGQKRRMLIGVPFVVAVLAAVVSLVIPSTYVGMARILPPQPSQASAAFALSGMATGIPLAAAALGLKNPSDLYTGMLGSDTVANALIDRFGLQQRYDEELRVDARRQLERRRQFLTDKNGIITIEVEADDPKLAADLANGYVEQLNQLTSQLAVTEAARRRLFLEKELERSRAKLADAEARLRAALDAGGLVSVEAQSLGTVETVARLRAEVSVRQVQNDIMRASMSPEHPDMMRAEQELASLRRELGRLESGDSGRKGSAALERNANGVSNIQRLREVKYQEYLVELLSKQYEVARLEESSESAAVQILDQASPPERRASPKRALLVLTALVLSSLATACGLVVREVLRSRWADGDASVTLAAVREAWGLRSRRQGKDL